MTREEILSILKANRGTFVSGEEISRQLGISRAAVSKAVAVLRTEGYEIRSATNRGYSLVDGPDRLSREEILSWLRPETGGTEIRLFDRIDSTNSYLKREAMNGAPHGVVAIAEEQTGGRGRLGRNFQSPPGTGVYISFLLRPQVAPNQAVNLTANIAVAVCDAIEAAAGIRPQIKWTNDIVMDSRKVCGILTEMSVEGESGALQYIVAGIGINVKQKLEDFPEELQAVAGSVEMAAGKACSRSRLTAEVINAMSRMYRDWLDGRWDIERYRRDCATIGKEVRVIRGGKERNAFAEGIDDDFALLVRYEDGTRETVFTGEVSVRGLEGYV